MPQIMFINMWVSIMNIIIVLKSFLLWYSREKVACAAAVKISHLPFWGYFQFWGCLPFLGHIPFLEFLQLLTHCHFWGKTVQNGVKKDQRRSNRAKRAKWAKQVQTGPNEAKSGQTEQNQAKPSETGGNGAKQGQTGQNWAKPG